MAARDSVMDLTTTCGDEMGRELLNDFCYRPMSTATKLQKKSLLVLQDEFMCHALRTVLGNKVQVTFDRRPRECDKQDCKGT